MKLLPVFLALLCATAPVWAQSEARLTVELLSETTSIAPGKPFTVGVKMKHIEHGHSYWKNPGGPGYATKFTWTLPDGFTAQDAQWPVPQQGLSAGFQSYFYEGEIMPLVTITAPGTLKAGETVTLDLAYNALVCTDTCKPERSKVSLKLTAAETAAPADAATQAAFAKARAALPVEPKSWSLAADKKGEQFTITLKPEAGANTKLAKAYFYSIEQVTDPAKPQTLNKEGDHWLLTVPPAADALASTTELAGVLQTDDGWLDGDAATKGFNIKLTLGAAAKSSASTSSQPASGAVTGGRSTGTLLLFAFLGGLILNIMPCVFPVIGIKILGFVQQAGQDRKKIVMHGLAYTLGVLLCFWALALFVILTGRGWGTQLQSPLFVLALCYGFMAFGLNMAGVFEIGTSAVGVGQQLQTKSGLQGSFFSGLLATVVATPCSAPFLGPALAWAVSLPPVTALLVFTVIGLGLSAPYLVLSISPGLVKLMPRPGAWMESFKQGMSFLLFGTVGFMLYTLAGLVDELHFLLTLFGLVLVAMACWIYGRWCLPHKAAQTRALGLGFAIIALGSGLYLGWPAPREKWQVWSPELVKQLRDEKKPVYIDFTARWCATCQVNKLVYHNDDVKKLISAKKVQLLKADWTDYDDRITQVLRDTYHKAAVPVNVLYLPGNNEPVILPELLTVANVSEALNRIP